MVEKSEKSMMEKCISYFQKECKVTPVLEGTSITKADADASYSTISFYLDVSGRSKMSLPLRLSISSKEALDHLLSARCVEPLPSNVTMDKENIKEGEYYHPGPDYSNLTGDSSAQLTFEITTSQQKVLMNTVSKPSTSSSSTASLSSSTAASGVLVEGMQLLSSTIEEQDGSFSLLFEVEVVVRVVGNKGKHQHRDQHQRNASSSGGEKRRLQTGRLEVMAVLTHTLRKQNSKYSAILSPAVPNVAFQRGFQNALRHTSPTMEQYRLKPFFLNLSLADALAIRVQSVPGPQIGSTLVSLTMKHPNTHSEPVTITNIAMHPGHSRLDRTMLMVERAPKRSVSARSLFSGVKDKDGDKSFRDDMQSSRRSIKSTASRRHSYRRSNSNVKESRRDHKAEGGGSSQQNQYGGLIDMSKSIQWGYAPSAEPKLPLTLYPHDAFSTIINVDAMEHMKSRTFLSPISVTAVVGQFEGDRNTTTTSSSNNSNNNNNNNNTTKRKNQVIIIASADAQWTTGRLALEPSDAFRVEMQLEPNESFLVGKPFTIHLRVLNMSADARDMMLLVAKDADKGFGTLTNKRRTASSSAANTAVVSEVNGYTFGVWGLMADKDDYHTFKLDRDQELLAIDAALLLGEVKGHHSVEAQLRFNPLREGTLSVPDMQLFDKRSRKWYYCTHKLSIVAHNNQKDGEETEV